MYNIENDVLIIPGIKRNLTFLHISDAHIVYAYPEDSEEDKLLAQKHTQKWNYANIAPVDAFAQAIQYANESKVDALFITGDCVDYISDSNVKYLKEQLKNVSADVLYVYGNHDRSNHWGECDYTTQQLDQAMEEAGVQVLSDEVLQLTEDLVLIGREDASFGGERDRAFGEQLMKEVDRKDFILLLDHQPLELESNRDLGVDLQLSGHAFPEYPHRNRS